MLVPHIIDCLVETYHNVPGAWQIFTGLKTGVGTDADANRWIDLYVFKIWVGGSRSKNKFEAFKKFDRIAYEIRMNRKDFLKDKKILIRQRPAKLACTHFYYVTPKGLIDPSEVPLDAGLIEINELKRGGYILTIIKPSPRFDYAPTWTFIASLLRDQAVKHQKQLENVAQG